MNTSDKFAKAKTIGRTKFNENNDCVVIALSIAGRTPYENVHSMLSKHGRKPRRGTTFDWTTVPAACELGL